MFTGRYEPIPGSGELTMPTTGEAMMSRFKADFMTPFLLTPGMEEAKRKETLDRVTALSMTAEKLQGTGQNAAKWVAGMAGSILNPYSLATGEAAGVALKPLIARGAGLVGRYAPSQTMALLNRPLTKILGERLPEFVGKESIASLTPKAVSGFAQATGFSLPAEIASTYDPTTDSFNWHGGIKASVEDGGFGLALMTAPYLVGILWKKVFRGVVPHEHIPLPGENFKPEHIESAVNKGWLTRQEGEWLHDYIFKNDSHGNLATRATEMLIKEGHPVDSATNQVMFKILHPDDVNNFHVAVSDSLAAKLPENVKGFYKDYIGHDRVDNLRENPNFIDGLQGVVTFVRKRLAKAPEEVIEFHKLMRRLLPEAVRAENPFTQAKIHRGEKKAGRTGLTVPHQVERRLKQDAKINGLKKRITEFERKLNKTGNDKYKHLIAKTEKEIRILTEKLQPLLSHADEMQHIRGVLLPEGKVAENFRVIREYGRLLDLTRVRNDARILLHEVNLKHEYELHEAFATLIDTMTKVMRSEFGKLAKVENINDYMKERIQGKMPEIKNLEIQEIKKEVQAAKVKLEKAQNETKTPEGREQAVKVLDEEIKESPVSEHKKEYEEIKRQYDEFKANESVFSSLIKCVLGAKNG